MSYTTDQSGYVQMVQDYQAGTVHGRAVADWQESRTQGALIVTITYADGAEPVTASFVFDAAVNSGPAAAVTVPPQHAPVA